jgi:hypothetical protein
VGSCSLLGGIIGAFGRGELGEVGEAELQKYGRGEADFAWVGGLSEEGAELGDGDELGIELGLGEGEGELGDGLGGHVGSGRRYRGVKAESAW